MPIYLDTEIWKASFMISQRIPKRKHKIEHDADDWEAIEVTSTKE